MYPQGDVLHYGFVDALRKLVAFLKQFSDTYQETNVVELSLAAWRVCELGNIWEYVTLEAEITPKTAF